MADGSISIDVKLNSQKAVAELAHLNAKITEQKNKVAQLSAELEKWQEIANKQKSKFGSVSDIVTKNLEQAQANLADAQAKLEYMTTQAEKVRNGLEGANEATAELPENLKASTTALDRFSKRVTGLIKRVFVFTLITRALSSVRSYLGACLKSNDDFSESLAKLKGALLTAFQPIYNLILPALIALMNVLTRVLSVVNQFMSEFFGVDFAKQAEDLNKEAKAINKVGGAAKKAQNQLAGFDQLNRLEDTSASGGGSSASSATISPDFSAMDEVSNKVAALELLMSSSLFALGAVLTFTGASIPVGLACMALGAAGMVTALKTNWGAISEQLQGTLGTIMAILSGAELAIGAVLTFTGANIPLGLGLMAVGSTGMAATIKANWNTIGPLIEENKALIEGTLGGMALVLGAVLTFSGASPFLGIPMMIAGIGSTYSAISLSWDSISEKLQGVTGKITGILGGALLAIGAILTMSGAATPLGLGLMAVGAAGLAAPIKANWESIVEKLQGTEGKITALWGAAFIALGILLIATGAGVPLGLGLLVSGCATLAAPIAANWNYIVEKVKGVWKNITNWFNTKVKPVFTVAYWKVKFSSISEGLKEKIKDGINAAIALFNKFVDWVNEKLHIEWKSLSLFGAEVVPAGSFQLLTLNHIPELAKGAVIPPNREFMAVLGDQKSGTNIETPLSTMVEAFNTALNQGMLTTIVQVGNQVVAAINAKDTATYLDGKQLAAGIYEQTKNLNVRHGKTLVNGV